MNEFQIVEYKGQRVLTTQLISELYETTTDTLTKNFNRNKEKYIEGKHYICLKGDELRSFKANGQIDLLPSVNTLYLWTEKGTFLHAKSLNTDIAWDVYDRLIDEYFKKKSGNDNQDNDKFMMCLSGVKFIADDLKIAESSRLMLYNGAFETFGLPTNFLPHYEDNGSRERKSATELLKVNGCRIRTPKFNLKLLEHGYLEEKERVSSKGEKKKYKALTDRGLKYGVNLISDKNQKETQPYYYSDTFMELYDKII